MPQVHHHYYTTPCCSTLAAVVTAVTVLVVVVVSSPALVFASSPSSSSSNAMPINFGSGFPLSLRPCGEDPKQKQHQLQQKSTLPPPTQRWIFDTSTSLVRSATDPANKCLETYGGVGPGNTVTIWDPCIQRGNFFYFWNNETSQVQQPYGDDNENVLCFGYENDAEGEEIRMYNCSDKKKKTALVRKVVTAGVGRTKSGSEKEQQQQQQQKEYLLMTPNNLCVGLPMPYTEYHQVQSSQFQIGVAVNGFTPDRNITYIALFKIWQPQFQKWSINMMDWSTMSVFSYYSTSSLTIENKTAVNGSSWYPAKGGRITEKTPTRLKIEGITLGPSSSEVIIATETWDIETIGTSFSWNISRTYQQQQKGSWKQLASRFATFIPRSMWSTVGRTGFTVAEQSPIISSLDTEFQRNLSSASGFFVPLGQHHKTGEIEHWCYTNTPRQEHPMLFSPMDVCVVWKKKVALTNIDIDNQKSKNFSVDFAYQVPGHAGGQGFNSVGMITTAPIDIVFDNNSNNKKSIITVDFTLDIPFPDDPGAKCSDASTLLMKTPNATRDKLARDLGRVFNMYRGWNTGFNSPASTSCIFESALMAQIASVFAPPPPPLRRHAAAVGSSSSSTSDNNNNIKSNHLPELFIAWQKQLDWFFAAGIVNETTGHVYSQWSQAGWANYGTHNQPSMFQQITQWLNCQYYYVVTTGDKDFLKRHWKTQIRKNLDYLLHTMNLASNKVPNAFGVSKGLKYPTQSSNWFDIIGFGFQDAVIAAEALQVLKHYEEITEWMMDRSNDAGEENEKLEDITTHDNNLSSSYLKNLHTEAVKKYNDLFWDEEKGMYASWVDSEGHRHSYNYVWNNALAMDPSSGAVGDNKTRAKILLESMDKNMERVRREMNVSDEVLWCTPTNFINVPPEHQVQPQAYGHYEDGACFMLNHALAIKMRFDGNQPKKALEMFDRAMSWFNTSRLWGQHYSWANRPNNGPGKFTDGDVLTDTTWLLYALVRGGLRIRPTLTKGIVVEGDPGAELEGMSHTFYHLGELVTARVVNGKTVIVYHHSKSSDDGSGVDAAGIAASVVCGLTLVLIVSTWYRNNNNRRQKEEEERGGGDGLQQSILQTS